MTRCEARLSALYLEQIKYAADKAVHITTNLNRLMANVGGDTGSKKLLLMVVMESILLAKSGPVHQRQRNTGNI